MSKHSTLADWMIIALSPLLIMALVGSLVFFLIEILYVGDYVERMRWILFCFVFGAVLLGRMSMLAQIADRSWLYGVIPGVLPRVGVQRVSLLSQGEPLAPL